MRELVGNDVIGNRGRQLHWAPMQPYFSLDIASSPLRAGAGELHRWIDAGHLPREMQNPRREQRQRLLLEPAADKGRDFALVARIRMEDGQVQQVGGNGFLSSGKERERQRTAAVKQSGALAPLRWKRLLVAPAPFGQRFDHPLSALS